MKRVFLVVSVLVFASLACQMTGFPSPSQPTIAPPPQIVITAPAPLAIAPIDLAQQQDTLVALYQRVNPGIVAIQVATPQGGALGSGFVYDSQGHVITNFHVVDGASDVEVDFTSGYKAHGAVVGIDKDSDIAVIKVDAPASELRPVTLGDSSTLQVGQSVVAIGNPFGLNGTMTTGIISALGRTMESLHSTQGGGFFSAADIIQTDAAINPGNSGGPLFNLNGEVIGINRAIETTNQTSTGEPVNSGIGFAISINIVKKVVPVLIAEGKYDYPYLGINFSSELSLDAIEALGLQTFTGAYVLNVTPGGPADKAGILGATQPTRIQGLNAGGDLITAVDGKPVRTFDELISYIITNKSPGDAVALTVLRNGQTQDITVTLGARPD
jgi:2-alkenal reductase